jgi:Uma2 family endonuclease
MRYHQIHATDVAKPMIQTLSQHRTSDQPADQRVLLTATWEQFQTIQQITADAPGVRLSFFAGTLEILMLGFEHEQFSEIIGYLITTFLLLQGIPFHPSGSMTQESPGNASTQADKSYCFGDAKPIPDLSIEVMFTSGGPGKLLKYQALGVPEVWFWEDGTLRLYHLGASGYEERSRSQLPGLDALDIALLKRCILMAETDFAAAIKVFQQEM